MMWMVTALLAIAGLALQVNEKGITALLSVGGLGTVAAIVRIIHDNLATVRAWFRKAKLWVLNTPLEWEIRGSATLPGSTPTLRVDRLLDLLLSTLRKSNSFKDRHSDFTVLGQSTDQGVAIHHKALGAAISIRLTKFAPLTADNESYSCEVVVSVNAKIGYRETTKALTGFVGQFFLELENSLRPSETKYEAIISVNEKNPFVGSFVQLNPKQISSFSVTAALSERTTLQVSKRRVSIISLDRGDFIFQAVDLVHRVA